MDRPAEPAPRPGLFQSLWFRVGVAVAVIEAILVAVGVIPRWPAIAIAIFVLVLYFLWGRNVGRPVIRQTGWALALSQALVLLVPIALWAIGAAVVVVLAVVAALLVAALIVDR